MSITPIGKLKQMEAQNIGNPILNSSPLGEPSPMGEEASQVDSLREEAIPGDISNGDIPEIDDQDGMVDEVVEEEQGPPIQKEKKKTLSNYIFKKLEEFGYPGRRLEEFKKKFVTQDISADGTETVKVEIPDKKYPNPNSGETETIEANDLTGMIREVNKMFGLNFTGAHRSEGKWTMDFSSAKVDREEDTAGMQDNLDEVYGTPSKGKNEKTTPTRAAHTLGELIKESKNKIVNKLKDILGEKNAS
jgi:hypothetical protein